MSTYIYLQCLEHSPPLQAHEESGQHLYDLDGLRADIIRRNSLVETWITSDYIDLGYFRNNTVRFLVQHPICHLGIVDEYGNRHSIELEEE